MPTAPRALITLVGRVTGPSGEPLPEAFLGFHPGEAPLERRYGAATTDSTGSYSVALLAGTYVVELDPPYQSGLLGRHEMISISERHARVDFSFLGFRVTGRVLDPNGTALDSGWVDARIPTQPGDASNALHGSYALVLPRGTYTFAAASANYLSGLPRCIWESVSIASDTTIDLRMEGIPVSGTVLAPGGAPMGNVVVEAGPQGPYSGAAYQTRSDGAYRLYLPPGSFKFRFSPPYLDRIMPRIVGPQTIDAPATIDCDLTGPVWTGTVRRSDTNQPAPGVYIDVRALDDPDLRTVSIPDDAAGGFRIVMEPNRRYDLSVYDLAVHKVVGSVLGITATADTTFDILIPPVPSP